MNLETEREKFETWVSSKCYRIKRNEGALQYATKNTQLLWQAWKARAALEAKQVEVKMLEPVAYIQHHKAGDNLEWDCPGNKYSALYTEQQLRALLAQHGIKIAD